MLLPEIGRAQGTQEPKTFQEEISLKQKVVQGIPISPNRVLDLEYIGDYTTNGQIQNLKVAGEPTNKMATDSVSIKQKAASNLQSLNEYLDRRFPSMSQHSI